MVNIGFLSAYAQGTSRGNPWHRSMLIAMLLPDVYLAMLQEAHVASEIVWPMLPLLRS